MTGNTACMAGKVKGQVRRLDLHPQSEFNEGDILVTEMTTPDLVLYMRKAGAVVTFIGGRTCHAAIVSREMGVACVVACVGARSLKDGQWVEVDTTGPVGIVTPVETPVGAAQ